MRGPRGWVAAAVLAAAVVGGCSGGSSGGAASGGTTGPDGPAGATGRPSSTSSTPSAAASPARPVVDVTRPGTVLLVPGYGGDVTDLDPVRAVLEARGRTVFGVRMPGDGTGSLREQARTLRAAADDAIAAGAPSVDVVGFSAGGVVARTFLADEGGAALTRRVVTIGSPHHGTALAVLAAGNGVPCPQACQDLAPASPLLTSLPEPLPSGGPLVVSLWSASDDVVAPPSSSVLGGAVSVRMQDVCADDRSRHTMLPRSTLVHGLVLLALADRLPAAPPGPDRCEALRRTG